MPALYYEYSGKGMESPQVDEFNAFIGRDFYPSDTRVKTRQSDVYISNARTYAGYIPICRLASRGVWTLTRRSWQQVRNSGSDIYLIWLPVRGSVTIMQGGRSTTIERGNVAISSSVEPLSVSTAPDDQNEHMSFQVIAPAHLVNQALAEPRQFCGTSFPALHGGTNVAQDLFVSLYNQAEHMTRGPAESLALAGLDIVFKSICEVVGDQFRSLSVKEARLQRLLDYMELHYCDSELSTENVAKACGISTRYLHYLLKGEGKSFNDYLWQSRLNCAYEQLRDPKLVNRTISEVAYSVGFKSCPHFSRAFRNQFSCSPKDVRQRSRAEATNSVNSPQCH